MRVFRLNSMHFVLSQVKICSKPKLKLFIRFLQWDDHIVGGIVGLGEVEKRVVFYGKEGISSFNVIRTFIQLPFSFSFILLFGIGQVWK